MHRHCCYILNIYSSVILYIYVTQKITAVFWFSFLFIIYNKNNHKYAVTHTQESIHTDMLSPLDFLPLTIHSIFSLGSYRFSVLLQPSTSCHQYILTKEKKHLLSFLLMGSAHGPAQHGSHVEICYWQECTVQRFICTLLSLAHLVRILSANPFMLSQCLPYMLVYQLNYMVA